MIKKFNLNKSLIISILIPLFVGLVSSLLSINSFNNFNLLNKPPLSPPGWLFPIVWTILYILMGISSYLVYEENDVHSDCCLKIYFLSLFINFLWSPIFFTLELRLFAFIFIVVLDLLVAYTIFFYYKVNKKAAYLQIPYLVWVLFATYLNLAIYILNR